MKNNQTIPQPKQADNNFSQSPKMSQSAMTLRGEIFAMAIEDALSKTTDMRWRNAIARAAEQITVDNPYWFFDGTHLTVTSAKGGAAYTANGDCQCAAFKFSSACWHRSAARLLRRYNELVAQGARFVVVKGNPPTPAAQTTNDDAAVLMSPPVKSVKFGVHDI